MWEEPSVVHFYSRLASFRRVVTFDKRGTGLSDPAMHAPTLEESVDDLRAVMDAAGCERADIVGISEGGTMVMVMTASHPDRVEALVLYGTFTRLLRARDYPLGVTEEQLSALVELSAKGWGEGVGLGGWAPSRRGDADLRRWWARLQRMAASPGMVRNIFALYPQLDIREVLPAIHVPTLVLHRRDDRMVSIASPGPNSSSSRAPTTCSSRATPTPCSTRSRSSSPVSGRCLRSSASWPPSCSPTSSTPRSEQSSSATSDGRSCSAGTMPTSGASSNASTAVRSTRRATVSLPGS